MYDEACDALVIVVVCVTVHFSNVSKQTVIIFEIASLFTEQQF